MAMCLRCGKESYSAAGAEQLMCPECTAALPRVGVTGVLIGLNSAVFLVMAVAGVSVLDPSAEQLVRWGASFGPYDLGTQWWRLLTASFVHIGILHILLNMVCLASLGPLAERIFGAKTFLALYLVTGLGGNIISVLVNPNLVAAGASGAIFGVAGVLLPVIYLRDVGERGQLGDLGIGLFVVYNLFSGMTHSGIDNAAHVGGLVIGALMGFALPLPALYRGRAPLWRTALVLVAASGALGAGFVEVRRFRSSLLEVEAARSLLLAGQMARGIERLERLVGRSPRDADAQYLLGVAYLDQGRNEEAVRALEAATRVRPNNSLLQDALGTAYVAQHRWADAAAVFKRETELAPDNAAAQLNLGAAYLDWGRPADAVAPLSRAVALAPDSASYHFLLGRAYLERQTFALAVAEFNAAVARAPGNVEAVLKRGVAYALLGRKDSARADFERILSLPLEMSASPGQRQEVRRLLLGLRMSSTALPPPFEVLEPGRRPPPKVYHCPALEYPEEARESGIGGRVTIEFQVDSTGMAVAEGARLVASDDSALTAPAWQMMVACSYEPGRLRGRPVRTWVRRTVLFRPPLPFRPPR